MNTVQFKDAVKLYLELQTNINDGKAKIKQFKSQQKTIENAIKSFMENNEIDDVNSKNMRLKYSNINRKEPLTKIVLSHQIENYLNLLEQPTENDNSEISNKDKALKMTDFIYKTREKKQSTMLNVNIKKPKKNSV